MRRFLAPIFFMLVASGIYVMYIDSVYGEIMISLARKDAIEKSIVDASTAKERIEQLAAIESSFPPDYEVKLRTLLPDSIDPTRLVVEVNAMALRNGLHITTPTIGKIENTKKTPLPYVRYTISYSVRATYAGFRSHLRDLESNLSLRDVTSIGFTSQETDADVLQYRSPELVPHDYSVVLVTYSLH